MGTPTSQLNTLEFILSREVPLAKLTPEQWVELLDATLREIGSQFEYLKVFGLNGLYRGAFEESGLVEAEKQAKHELYHLTRQPNGRHFVLNRNKTWGWFRLDTDVKPHLIAEHALGLGTYDLLPMLEGDAHWPNGNMLGYELYTGIMQVIEKGIEVMYERLYALEDNLKQVRQQGMRVSALYAPHPPMKEFHRF